MPRILAALCVFLSLLAVRTHAAAWDELDLRWGPPTTCFDRDTNLTNCPVIGYKIQAAGDCSATKWNLLATVGPVTNYHASKLAPGTYCFRTIASNSDGDSSPSLTVESSKATITAPTTPCPAPPASETRMQACAAPLIGSWSQTRVPQAVEPPACWAMGAWTPDVAPAGVCASPPTQLVTTSTEAYMLVPGVDTYAPLLIGSIPLGTRCDATKALLGFYVVPRASVTYTGAVKKPPVVVGRCG